MTKKGILMLLQKKKFKPQTKIELLPSLKDLKVCFLSYFVANIISHVINEVSLISLRLLLINNKRH